MKYSLIIPARNEAKNIVDVVSKADAVLKKTKKSYEIIVVNDNSVDKSLLLLKNTQKKVKQLRILNRTSHPGVGYAKRAGLAKAKGDIIITLDGDGSHNPEEIPKLLKALSSSDMVCGSRYMQQGKAEMALSRVIISKLFNVIFRTLIGIQVKDFTSGYKAYKKTVVDKLKLKSKNFGIYIEIPLQAHLMGCKLKEVPITYSLRKHGRSHLSYLKQGPEYLWVVTKMIVHKLVKF